MKINPCPLCESVDVKFYSHSNARDFFICANCHLIFTTPKYHLTSFDEKSRYDKHQNHVIDEGYKSFLYQVIDPLLKRVKPHSKGLDYGCGPFPALAKLLEKENFKMAVYDPFYALDDSVFTTKYDFITLTEVVEHMYYPAKEFKKMIALLKPNAYLAIMTSRTNSITNFNTWHYKNDHTHVCFYADESFVYLAKKYDLILETISESVVFFKKVN